VLGRTLAVSLVALAGIVFVVQHWGDDYQWKPDSLFYEAQLLRVQGDSKQEALRRVFGGPLAAARVSSERSDPPAERRVSNPAWVSYSERFYDRRWFVPALGAAVEPWLRVDALRAVSLVGYCLTGLVVFALLSLRFSSLTSAVVALLTLALAPVRYWSVLPLTDSFGVALEAGALACALLALARPRRWLLPFALSMAALSFTRDATIVVVAGLVGAAALAPTRTRLAVLATGVLASIPALVLFGAPARELIAYTLNDFRPPPNPSWSFIRARYWTGEKGLVHDDLLYLVHHPYVGVFAIGGLLSLFVLRGTRSDPALPLIRAGLVGAVVLLALAPNYTKLRLELPFVPLAAFGVALAIERLAPSVPKTVRSRFEGMVGSAGADRSRPRLERVVDRDRCDSQATRGRDLTEGFAILGGNPRR
jgi:hypothetical protein